MYIVDGSLAICDKGIMCILRLLDLDLGIGIHVYAAKMSDWGGGNLYHYSVNRVLLEYVYFLCCICNR